MNNIEDIKKYLKEYNGDKKVIMEVCGTHTASISENGIPDMLSDKIELISGPGCPVCVTVAAYVDKLIELSMRKNTCVVTFGDMLRVCGSKMSLRDAAANGADVSMVYSPFDIIRLAKSNTKINFVFAAVGFETTTPIYALIVEEIINSKIKNVKLLTALKTMPQAIKKVTDKNSSVTGFLAPGHVSVITGSDLFKGMAKELNMPFVIAGFTGEELLSAIYALTKLNSGRFINMYPSVVTPKGNTEAQKYVDKYFKPCAAAWRGLGIIDNSGMILKDEYKEYDAGSYELTYDHAANIGCRCGSVISGQISPLQCPLFGSMCKPESPQGACMVSNEGSCYHYYINNRK